MSNFNNTESILKAIEFTINSKNQNQYIGLHEPYFKGSNALKYLKSCIDSGWVSSAGSWINKFEEEICKFTGAKYSVAVTNGTVGLRLALYSLGIKPNDEVIIPPLSFVATANCISHLGAVPHFVDIDKNNLGLCPKNLQKRLELIAKEKSGDLYNIKTGRRIKAIMPVHIFGIPANVLEIKKVADSFGLPIIEDLSLIHI